MVGLVLVSHSHALAVAVKELVVAMAGPKLPIAIAAGSGENHADLGTNGVEVMEAINSVMGDDGVLVLMDMGSAVLSTETALDFLDETVRARVRCAAAPFVEGAVAAGVTATLGNSLDEVCHEAAGALRRKSDHLCPQAIRSANSPRQESATPPGSPTATVKVLVPNPHGLHARPAARFIREAAVFSSEIQVRNLTKGTGPVSAKSLTGLASLGILHGHEMEIIASGADAEAAAHALQRFVEAGLGDALEGSLVSAAPYPEGITATSDASVAVSSGLVLGPLRFAASIEPDLPTHHVADPENEIRKLHQAIEAARAALVGEQSTLRKSLGRNEAEIFEAQSLLLDDPALRQRVEASIRKDHTNAAQAWDAAFRSAAANYAQLDDEYLRQRAADVRDIGASVLAALGIPRPQVGDLPEPGILVVDDLTPAEAASLSKTVLGVICLAGGKTSHAAILLRARGVPAIVRARTAFERAGIHAGSGEITGGFDGDTGELWLDPSPEKRDELRARVEAQRAAGEEAAQLSHQPAVTIDGHVVKIFANLGEASEAAAALERGAEGVGLFRTEFLFLDREAAPNEDEQYEALREVREVMGSRPVVIRTLDIGGDKEAPYLGLAREANPFLGERGIRVCLHRPELFQVHLRAILRAAHGGNFQIMFPMITDLAELRDARDALEQAHDTLARSGVRHAWPVPVGIMIEVPSAAVLSDQLILEADFFSIGTNDLTQYVLAADRGNPSLTRFQDAVHPAVLRMLDQIIASAHRRGKHVAVCGESAADPIAARLLVGLGIDELSLTPAKIPAIKSTIRASRKTDLQALANRALRLSAATEVRAAARAMALEVGEASQPLQGR
jgi:phosphocarrier protein FPr